MSYDKYKTFGTEKQSDFAKALADKLISQLQKGTSPWQRPEVVLQAPINALTGKPYRGGNALALMLCQKIGIGHNFENHASYVGAWVRILQDNPNEILRASRDAEKISDYIMAFDRELVQDNRNNQPQEGLKQEYFEAKTKGFTAGSTILEAAIKKAELIMNGQATIQSPLLAHADKYEVTTHLLAGASNEASFMTDIHTRSIINKVFEAGLDIIELDEEYNRTHKSIVDAYGEHFSRLIALEELIYQERNNEYEITM